MHLYLCILTLSLTTHILASPVPRSPPSQEPLFTIAAFQPPYPPGSNLSGSLGISGVPLRASNGLFYINPSSPPSTLQTVLRVTSHGESFLDSKTPQQVYLDTRTGALSFLTPISAPEYAFAPGASVVNFLHLGQGTSVTSSGGGSGFAVAGPGTFDWLGSPNDSWFLCPRPGPGYQVLKQVGGLENWGACVGGIQLVALDYVGASPAAGVYV